MQTPPSTAAPTPRYQVKREAILGAAARLFNERGVRGATLADIAASVGLVTNSVTYYYRKKEDLATACLQRAITVYDELAASSAQRHRGVAQRLQAFFRQHALWLADIEAARQAPIVTFNDIRALPRPQADAVFGAYTNMFRRVRGLLQGPETAALARADLNARSHIVLSLALWLRGWMVRYEQDEYERVAERVSELLLRGMAGPGVRWQAAEAEAEAEPGAPLVDDAGPLEAFLRAATALVNEQGYRGASVDKISARLNVTKGSFYHHNDTKHDLIAECFERSFSVMRQALRRAEDGSGSGWQRAGTAARALVRYQLSARGPLLRTTATSALPDRSQREHVRLTQDRLAERLANVVVDGMMDGSIRALDSAIAAQALIAVINAAAELQRWVPGANASNAAALYVRPAFEGVLCPGAAPV